MRRAALNRVASAAASVLLAVALTSLLVASAGAAYQKAHKTKVAHPRAYASQAGPSASLTPSRARIKLYVPDAFFVSRHAVTVPGRSLHVTGVVRPYVPGQLVAVRVFLGRRLLESGRFRLKPSRHLVYGSFTVTVRSPGVGELTVVVKHAATTTMEGFSARRRVAALSENIGFGSTGRFVQLIQQRLAALHLYLPQTGVYDSGTGLALDAYHRLLRWGTYQTLDGRTISFLLNGWGGFPVHYKSDGRHAEGNLTLQLLALIDGSKVVTIYPISSGKPSTPTILGRFHVYSKVPGYLPDGMYFSNFFFGGYAIHGYNPAPDYPASHGCMRLPIVDAISAYNWLQYGNAVDVYL
ncbi:MAG: L,D-transpeptidase [Actinomycetota bacterium]|nr:L,D-transpeptidase [Actinomycetota bacterium]